MIISIDPGKTTGIVIAQNNSVYEDVKLLITFELKWEDRFALPKIISEYNCNTVICEDFIVAYSKTQPLAGYRVFSAQLIGVIQQYCHDYDIELFMQPPNKKNRISIDQKLTAGEHVKDAYKHLKYYLAKREFIS